jgi:exodeoxyribonuclease VII large subunit
VGIPKGELLRPTDSLDIELSVSDFVALHNQLLEQAFPSVVLVGELSSFRVSKNRWVYFDLKDELASVKFFGTVYQLPGPLEDGMLLKVRGTPRVHPQFGFSITIQSIQLAGEGTLRRAADLLQQKLTAEGLFDPTRKRSLPYPPESLGIITSKESAAYADVSKILAARWGGLDITLADVQVQGEPAPLQIAEAIAAFNQQANPPEVLLLTRGGGSAEDLQAFNSEVVVRAVAASRIPTIVAIGHEVDTSLAELAADVRASTPSNAAELLVPDRIHEQTTLANSKRELGAVLGHVLQTETLHLKQAVAHMTQLIENRLARATTDLTAKRQMLELLSPEATLRRGYVLVRDGSGKIIRSSKDALKAGHLALQFADGKIRTKVENNKEAGKQ